MKLDNIQAKKSNDRFKPKIVNKNRVKKSNACFKCGKKSHYAKECHSKQINNISRHHSLIEVTINITNNLRESSKTVTVILDSEVKENYVSLNWVKKEKIEWDIKKHLYELHKADK